MGELVANSIQICKQYWLLITKVAGMPNYRGEQTTGRYRSEIFTEEIYKYKQVLELVSQGSFDKYGQKRKGGKDE